MLALCADGALGRYAPYGRESVVPIRGGICHAVLNSRIGAPLFSNIFRDLTAFSLH